MSTRYWFLLTQTGDRDGAGTNADTWVGLYGDAGRSPQDRGYYWVLDNPGGEMERGELDGYYIPFEPQIGRPTDILLWFDPIGHGSRPEWFCDYMRMFWVEVNSHGQWTATGDEAYQFDVYRWFDTQGYYPLPVTSVGHTADLESVVARMRDKAQPRPAISREASQKRPA